MESGPDHPSHESGWGKTKYIDYCLYPPGGDSSVPFYVTQAARPSELHAPGNIAEGWDSPDIDTAPNANFWSSWEMENLGTGWHVGPFNRNTNGLALLNGSRHPRSPNVLYADGSVRADVRRRVDPSELGACPIGTWEGLKTNTWEDVTALGTLHHIVPVPEFYK